MRRSTLGCSVQFSSVPCPIKSSGVHKERFSRDPLPIFSAGGHCEQFWHGQGRPLFHVAHPAYPLPTTASPTLQGALNDDFGEAVVICDMSKPCRFPSLDFCQTIFLWTHKEVDLAPHQVAEFVFQVADTKKFPHAVHFESLDPFFSESASRFHVLKP